MNAAAHTLTGGTGGTVRRPPTAALAGWIITPVLLALAALFVADRLYNPERFRIEAVEVQGRFSRVDAGRVKAAVANTISGNYFSLSLPRIEARVEELPWVFSASVRRQWPATLVVEVAEVQPVAKWGTTHWLHFTGDLVARPAGSRATPAEHDLPLLSGPDDRRQAVWQAFRRWSERFAAKGLRLDQLRLDARDLWHLRLSPGALVRDGNAQTTPLASPAPPGSVTLVVAGDNAEARIAQFAEVLAQQLMTEFAAMRSIDLRHPNGFAVGWKTPSPPVQASPNPES